MTISLDPLDHWALTEEELDRLYDNEREQHREYQGEYVNGPFLKSGNFTAEYAYLKGYFAGRRGDTVPGTAGPHQASIQYGYLDGKGDRELDKS